MMLKKISSLLFFIVLGLSPLHCMAETANESEQVNMQTITLSVPGMTCATCPITVKKALESVNGVSEVKVNFKAKTATVTFNPHQASVSDLTTATLEKAGYPSTLVPKL